MDLAPALSIKKIIRATALYGTGIVIGIIVVVMWESIRSPSPLTAHLPSEWNGASAEFDSRLRTQFPLGMPANDFIRELTRQGFKPTWFVSGGYYGALRNEGWLPCRVSARVYWRLGPGDTLAYINGDYREEGCM